MSSSFEEWRKDLPPALKLGPCRAAFATRVMTTAVSLCEGFLVPSHEDAEEEISMAVRPLYEDLGRGIHALAEEKALLTHELRELKANTDREMGSLSTEYGELAQELHSLLEAKRALSRRIS